MIISTQSLLLSLFPLVALSQDGSSLQASLVEALTNQEGVTHFQGLLQSYPTLLNDILGGKEKGITLLIPDDEAVTHFLTKSNFTNPTQLSPDDLKVPLQYHVMDAVVRAQDLADKGGNTIPTVLKEELYNNRTAGEKLIEVYGREATGQVLFVSDKGLPTAKNEKRQDDGLVGVIKYVRAGLEQSAEMEVVDGTWGPNQENYYQIVKR